MNEWVSNYIWIKSKRMRVRKYNSKGMWVTRSYDQGRLHNIPGFPAVIRVSDCKKILEYYRHGKYYREDDKPVKEVYINNILIETYFAHNGRITHGFIKRA